MKRILGRAALLRSLNVEGGTAAPFYRCSERCRAERITDLVLAGSVAALQDLAECSTAHGQTLKTSITICS